MKSIKLITTIMLIIISQIIIISLLQKTFSTTIIQKPSNIEGISYDMLFNMHTRREVLRSDNYHWTDLNETTIVCLYGLPKEGDSDRNICLLAKQWLSVAKRFIVVSDHDFECENVVAINQATLGASTSIRNPFTISWYLRNLDIDEFLLINDDDLVTRKTTRIITNPLYFPGKLILHNEGDLAQYRVLKKLFSYGGDFINVPIHPVMHGPMFVKKKDIIRAHKLLKLERMSDCRDGDVWSLTAAVGALNAIEGYARLMPAMYHHYLQLTSDSLIPIGYKLYCLNDGPELINSTYLNKMMMTVFSIND